MGSKSESKNIMEGSGVPCVPGYHGEDQALDTLLAEARPNASWSVRRALLMPQV